MHDETEHTRATEFLQSVEKNPALPLTPTGITPASFYARRNQQSNNPQETHGASPLENPQLTNLAALPCRD